MKKWILYHGTGLNEAQEILKYGLKPSPIRPLFLTPDKNLAKVYSLTKRGGKYLTETYLREKGVILQVTITENDFINQIKNGSDERIVNIRRDNIERALKEKWTEYEWYYTISPKNIRILK